MDWGLALNLLMLLSELQHHVQQSLQIIGLPTSEIEAEVHCIFKSLGFNRLKCLTAPETEITAEIQEQAEDILARRLRREPLQYILGSQDFYGLALTVSPAVLIPRPETEELVALAYRCLDAQGVLQIADLGTGSGAIALALAHQLNRASRTYTIWASDFSRAALELARHNGRRQNLDQHITWLWGDGLEPLREQQLKLDLLVSNPPYISRAVWQQLAPEVRDFEPQMALTPGEDGLYFYRLLAQDGPALLRSGGWLCVELDACQAEATADLFSTEVWDQVTLKSDFNGYHRFLCAERV